MDDPRQPNLDEALRQARALPMAQQDALASEVLARVEELKSARISATDEAEVKRRLAAPSDYVSDAEVAAFFGRHGLKA